MAQRPSISEERFTEIHTAIQAYLSGTSSLDSTATALSTLAQEPSPEIGLDSLWTVILILARSQPPTQPPLVDLVVSLSRLPDETSGDGPLQISGQTLWKDLPGLAIAFNHERNALSLPPEDPREEEEGDDGRRRTMMMREYVSVNAFAARLSLRLPPSFTFLKLFCLSTLRSALEMGPRRRLDRSGSRFPIGMEVRAAAEWVDIAGREMYWWDEEFEHGPLLGRPGAGGPLWDGMHGFCVERWELWKKRFGELAGGAEDGLDEESRTVARAARQAMEKLEVEEGAKED